MPPVRIDFYLLSEGDESLPLLTACRLIEKAYLRGHTLFVYCQTLEMAEKLDELLWTFKPESFIAHNLQGEGPHPPPPVQMGTEAPSPEFRDVLLNLSGSLPSFYRNFRRVAEIVPHEESDREACRMRYREYRRQNCVLHTHELSSSRTP